MDGPELADDGPALILVVDDNATSRYVMGSWLGRAGHTVIEAADGAQGLAALETAAGRSAELAIVDVRLPDMSGFEVCERIKAAPRTAGLPVVHVSATAIATADRAQGLARGADAYLTEPIAPNELLATVTAALRYGRARRYAELLARRLSTLNEATLEVYGSADGESLAGAAARGASALMQSTVLVLTEPHGTGAPGPVRMTTAEPDRVPVGGPAPADLLRRLSELTLGDRVGVEITRVPPEVWTAHLPGGALTGEVALVLARAKAGRPAVGIAVAAEAAGSPQDLRLAAQFAQACALVLEALREEP